MSVGVFAGVVVRAVGKPSHSVGPTGACSAGQWPPSAFTHQIIAGTYGGTTKACLPGAPELSQDLNNLCCLGKGFLQLQPECSLLSLPHHASLAPPLFPCCACCFEKASFVHLWKPYLFKTLPISWFKWYTGH